MDFRKVKRWMRRYARYHGLPIPSGLRMSNRWGRYAKELARTIQKRKGWEQTGACDARLVREVKPFQVKLMRLVRNQVGTKEWPPGSNWGEVRPYLEAAGINFPTPWCAAFVTWCLKKNEWRHGFPHRPGWVPAWDTFLRNKGYEVAKLRARSGDIVTFNWDSDSSSEHIGFVVRNLGPMKEVVTIEGNATSPEIAGGGVVRKTRPWYQVNHVYRLPAY